MKIIRRRLIALALGVIACQAVGTAAASVVLCQMGRSAIAGDVSGMMTTCDHGPNVECPMHKRAPSQSSSRSSRENRLCRDCSDTSDMIVTTLGAFSGPPTDGYRVAPPLGVSAAPAPSLADVIGIDRLPAAPPPRS